MKKNNFSLKEGFWFGLVKFPIVFSILFIAGLIFYSSLRYVEPTYTSGYLLGNDTNYYSAFRIGLIVHLIVAPIIVLTSSILLFFRIERNYPKIHRLIGKSSIYAGVFLLIPSGFILSYYAIGGIKGQLLFGILTLLSLVSLVFAFNQARKRNITQHKKWIIRFYILLTSAIWLRINMFVGSYFFNLEGPEFYLKAAFLSWVPQLLIYELFLRLKRNN